MVKVRHRGNFNKTERFLNSVRGEKYLNTIDQYAQLGVEALRAATPSDSGKTAESWTYEIERGGEQTTITWLNTNVNNHVNIAIILQYGHATGTGGYVEGRDYINPALKPIFDMIGEKVWKVVKDA